MLGAKSLIFTVSGKESTDAVDNWPPEFDGDANICNCQRPFVNV